MCCISGSVFRPFTSVPLRGRGCWDWPYTSEMPDEHQVTAHPKIIPTPCISSTSAQKRSLRAEIMLLIPIQSVHPPKGGTSCDCGIYPSCSHPTPNWELHWMQPARIYIFIRLFSLFTPHLFFWLSLTQLQLLQFNLFLHKGPGVDSLISRGWFQRCLLPQVVSPYLWE